jgi:hypothetical protein
VLDIDLDLRISGVVSLGEGAGRGGVLRPQGAPGADTSRSPSQDKSLRLLPNSGSGAGNQVRQLDRRDGEIQTPNIAPSPHEAAEPESHNELAEAERLLKSLASALALRRLSRAAMKTRHAIAKAKRAMKSKDAERIRQANEGLRKAAMRLAEALRRVRAAGRL